MSLITGNSTIDYVTHSVVPCSFRRCINLPGRVGDTRHPGFPCRQMDDQDQPVAVSPSHTDTQEVCRCLFATKTVKKETGLFHSNLLKITNLTTFDILHQINIVKMMI